VPIRGARVHRAKWFHAITQTLEAHGFHRGAPNIPPCPGRYFFSRDGYAIQILPDRMIRITRPTGQVDVQSAASMSRANFILGALVRYIESPRTA
jgi:hypothetical protein